jgi:hypothetical protein
MEADTHGTRIYTNVRFGSQNEVAPTSLQYATCFANCLLDIDARNRGTITLCLSFVLIYCCPSYITSYTQFSSYLVSSPPSLYNYHPLHHLPHSPVFHYLFLILSVCSLFHSILLLLLFIFVPAISTLSFPFPSTISPSPLYSLFSPFLVSRVRSSVFSLF